MIRAAFTLALLCLTVCAGAAQADRAVTGSVIYRDRMALPPDAVLLVELVGADGSLLAEVRLPAEGRQVPLPFELEVPDDAAGSLRAGLMLGAVPTWLGAAVAVDGSTGDLGELVLARQGPMDFPASYRCGDRVIRVGAAEGAVVLDTRRGAWLVMEPVPAASGARYERPGEAETFFWDRGDVALVALSGVDLPECRAALPPVEGPYRAQGNEPFWSMDVSEGVMILRRMGMADASLRVTERVLTGAGTLRVMAADATGAGRAVMERRPAICRDSMSGMPYPETVKVSLGGETLTGCGGASIDLLTGRTWVVEDIAGTAPIAESRLTMVFAPDGRVAGSGGCNQWFSTYAWTGEGVTIGQAGATMMACSEPIMAQEQRFFAALARVTGFDVDATGALVLLATERPILTARAAAEGSAP
ncbi:META domain-containing protein [Roseicyclus marinus]|uniref:META domain-containing protein n=1 Tax=Roseicyclus marinus TaxID=2161673 RepID=UPI00241098BC|nr:META domain-containing protein [Roseicyclus marinus]MDG3042172.1 META domain-containing protein [Roseicyclus marinus]